MGEKKRRLSTPAPPPATAHAPVPQRARQLFDSGRAAHRRQQFVDAINAYQAAFKLAPDLVEAQHFQGLAFIQLGLPAVGLNLLRLSIAAAPANAAFHFNLGKALLADEAPAAIAALRQAALLAPAELEIALELSEALLRLDRLADSIAELERAHALQPRRWETLLGLAQRYYRDNQLERARRRYQQALELHPALYKTCRIGYAAPLEGHRASVSVLNRADLPGNGFGDDAALRHYLADASLQVLDGVLPDPAAYRRAALALDFHAHRYAGQNYPGLQTDGYDCQALMQEIATALGRTIKFVSPDNGSYRISTRGALARNDIHVDNESGDQFNAYAGVLYLNTPEQCQGGTTFWRHVDSGWTHRPSDTDTHRAGYPSFRHFQKRWLPLTEVKPFHELPQRQAGWQALLEVPMRQNRLIIYRGHYFHSISNVFGSTPEDSRLVQLFFFEVVEDAAPAP